MVSHQRLQHYRANYCRLCMTGLLGCRWHRYKQSTRDSRKRDLMSFTVLVVTFLYILFYFYFWLVAVNDYDDLNWYIYTVLNSWYPWYKVFLGLTSAIFIYYVILMCLTLLHVIQGYQVYVYPLHVLVSIVTLAACISTTVILDNLWSSEWQVLRLSLQITGPFLHVGAVCMMTCLTWIIAGHWLQLSNKAFKLVWLFVYIAGMVCLYLCPLIINSPCVLEVSNLPPKPQLIGHRGGAPMLAPENTLFSLQSAIDRGVGGWETDVRISEENSIFSVVGQTMYFFLSLSGIIGFVASGVSGGFLYTFVWHTAIYDGVPFLLHDYTFRRTTNISKAYPELADMDAMSFNISQIKTLDAGSWFLELDPYDSVSSLTPGQREVISQQKVPTFEEMLELSARADKSVMFDLFMPFPSHPHHNNSIELVVKAIKKSGIQPEKIFWMLKGELPPGGEGFTLMSRDYMPSNKLRELNFSAVNLEHGAASHKDLRQLNEDNITVNIYMVNTVWMFSLYWCVGTNYVSTDMCHIFENVDGPVWHLSPQNNLILWVTVDVLSAILVVATFILQRVRLYGTKFNPETLSLQSGRTDNSYEHVYKTKNMKQRLLRGGDHFENTLDHSNGSLNSSSLSVGSYCLHTMNGTEQITPSFENAANSNSSETQNTEIRSELPGV